MKPYPRFGLITWWDKLELLPSVCISKGYLTERTQFRFVVTASWLGFEAWFRFGRRPR